MRTVIFLLAFASALFFGSLAAPILVGFAFGEADQVVRLSILASSGAFVSTVVMTASLGYRHALTPNRLILAMVLVWLLLALIGTTPFVLVMGLPFEQALFESVSGLTTTGASTFAARETIAAVDPVLAVATGVDRRLPDAGFAFPRPVAARDRRPAETFSGGPLA